MSGLVPKVELSCLGCEHERSVSYTCDGVAGHLVLCAHPNGSAEIGDTTWKTPNWCPLLAEAKAKLKEEM